MYALIAIVSEDFFFLLKLGSEKITHIELFPFFRKNFFSLQNSMFLTFSLSHNYPNNIDGGMDHALSMILM